MEAPFAPCAHRDPTTVSGSIAKGPRQLTRRHSPGCTSSLTHVHCTPETAEVKRLSRSDTASRGGSGKSAASRALNTNRVPHEDPCRPRLAPLGTEQPPLTSKPARILSAHLQRADYPVRHHLSYPHPSPEARACEGPGGGGNAAPSGQNAETLRAHACSWLFPKRCASTQFPSCHTGRR